MKELLIIDDERILNYGIFRDDFKTSLGFQVEVHSWTGTVGEPLSFYDSNYNRYSEEELIEKGLIEKKSVEIFEEEYAETPDCNIYEEPVSEKNEILEEKESLYDELNNLDLQSLRPLRAILTGCDTAYDRDKLSEIEKHATAIRLRLKELENETPESD